MLVITSYPSRGNNIADRTAVAWHSKRLLRELAKQGKRIVVLAEKTGNTSIDSSVIRDGKNIIVLRVWKKGSITALFHIAKAALRFDQVHQMLFQFEFNVFGGLSPVIGIPVLLSFLRLLGKSITFEFHQVVNDVSRISHHINIKNSLLLRILSMGLHAFYTAVGFLSQNILVFESQLLHELSTSIPASKITVVPLAVVSSRPLTKNNARKALNIAKRDFVIMSFGFVNWYKGSDWIVKTVDRQKNTNIKLLLAGGASATLKDKAYYKKYYSQTIQRAENSTNIVHTDFIPEKLINRYFAASDVVVFPYRVLMSSSGPLAHALSHQKPVLFSSHLHAYFQNDDMRLALQKSDLKFTDVMFDLDHRDFMKKLDIVQSKYDQFVEFSASLAKDRHISSVAKKYLQIMSSTPSDLIPLFKVLFARK